MFLKGVADDFQGASLDVMEGSIAVLYSYNEEDEHAPLKVINNFRKQWKKAKLDSTFDYVGGWYDTVWQDAAYVGELAALPSKEELVGKFLYMLNHPVSSFARVVKAIADKDPAEEVASEETAEETPAASEEVVETTEQSEETQEAATEQEVQTKEAQAEESQSEESAE